MDDARLVRSAQALEELVDHGRGLGRREAAALADALLQGDALEVLHDQEAIAVGELPGIEHLDDVRRSDAACCLRLALEALRGAGVGGETGVQRLEGDAPVDADALGFVDGAHPALADEAHDAVLAAVDLTGLEAHPRRPG